MSGQLQNNPLAWREEWWTTETEPMSTTGQQGGDAPIQLGLFDRPFLNLWMIGKSKT
jgi:hypothetical protein